MRGVTQLRDSIPGKALEQSDPHNAADDSHNGDQGIMKDCTPQGSEGQETPRGAEGKLHSGGGGGGGAGGKTSVRLRKFEQQLSAQGYCWGKIGLITCDAERPMATRSANKFHCWIWGNLSKCPSIKQCNCAQSLRHVSAKAFQCCDLEKESGVRGRNAYNMMSENYTTVFARCSSHLTGKSSEPSRACAICHCSTLRCSVWLHLFSDFEQQWLCPPRMP